jgi:putative hydrolase of the HAD superfamily
MWFDPLPRAVLIDVGFTLTFCDGDRIAASAAVAGITADPSALHRVESLLRAELKESIGTAIKPHDPAGKAWGETFFRRMLELAAGQADPDVLDRAAEIVWRDHLGRNIWCRVGSGVKEAVARLRAGGFRLAVVSNSEGTVEAMLEEVGLRSYFETVVDSWVVGVAKPDPEIFAITLRRLGLGPEQAMMVGDSPRMDVAGARAAGIRAALLDPLDLYPAVEAPRFHDLGQFADELLSLTP